MMPLQAVKSFIAEHAVSGKVFAGFSGGADSTALLLALHETGMDVTAVHFNHGIRGDEADADEEWSRNFCAARNISFISEHLNVPANIRKGESTEEAARRLRIEAWIRISQARPVFIAHHADDTLEELFLRLARGSNVSALVPMRPVRQICGVTFLRPFLKMRKARLEEWLRSKGIGDWRIDSTNSDNSYRRNAVRNRLLPLFREIFGNDSGLLM
ncbi:MAG: tRNA lysidine(34) synthetase TilS, partial [Victivallales bacterium]|nr:tRNA lysidine(34) synthetase TilS [Victivallales bacterium]